MRSTERPRRRSARRRPSALRRRTAPAPRARSRAIVDVEPCAISVGRRRLGDELAVIEHGADRGCGVREAVAARAACERGRADRRRRRASRGRRWHSCPARHRPPRRVAAGSRSGQASSRWVPGERDRRLRALVGEQLQRPPAPPASTTRRPADLHVPLIGRGYPAPRPRTRSPRGPAIRDDSRAATARPSASGAAGAPAGRSGRPGRTAAGCRASAKRAAPRTTRRRPGHQWRNGSPVSGYSRSGSTRIVHTCPRGARAGRRRGRPGARSRRGRPPRCPRGSAPTRARVIAV